MNGGGIVNGNQKLIKRDLLYLYKVFQQSPFLFEKKIANKLKYSLEEVEHALELDNSDACKKTVSMPQKQANTSQITDIDRLRSFYYSDLKQLYDHSVDESIKAEILKSISLDEFKRLYAIISGVQLSNNTKKLEVAELLRNYFNGESRTKSLMKNL